MHSPALYGKPVRIEFQPGLSVHQGKLLSEKAKGTEVHAGSFVPARRIVLDTALLTNWDELNRILVHELFHFAWVRLGNPKRRAFEAILHLELQAKARGELGWSAEWRKKELSKDDIAQRTRLFRHYVVESFCDTAACLYSGCRTHAEFTLAARWKNRREIWFQGIFQASGVLI